jgi:hypothetical protein
MDEISYVEVLFWLDTHGFTDLADDLQARVDEAEKEMKDGTH